MDRTRWRQERRLWNQVQMDTIYARQYDEKWGGSINSSHQHMLEQLLDLCPRGGRILDAACGTGKYWPLLLERGFSIQGTDQSQQMLQRAHSKFPAVSAEHIGLQELTFSDAFDAVMCMDAMEMVFPEDWPVVLGKFAQALHKSAYLYFTVEVETEEELQVAYDAGKRLGLPLIYGEYAHHGGYHYYPTDEQVRSWLAEAHFTLLEMTEGDGYRHYLTLSSS
ncbi:MAG: class I SAM-dependent methyltransferase [Chloroflexota bacterium]|nr:class I SAM-dependent methyltransferase [Chloroflexota bacterium]